MSEQNAATATWPLAVAAFCMTVVAGVGVYQSLFVMPEYFSSPPESLRRYQADTSWKFWLPLHAVTLPALLLMLAAAVLFTLGRASE